MLYIQVVSAAVAIIFASLATYNSIKCAKYYNETIRHANDVQRGVDQINVLVSETQEIIKKGFPELYDNNGDYEKMEDCCDSFAAKVAGTGIIEPNEE